MKKINIYDELFGLIIMESFINHYFFFMDLNQRVKLESYVMPIVKENKNIKE